MEEARAYLLERIEKQGDYDFLPEGVLPQMVDKLMELDIIFMEETGVTKGLQYDDEEALEALRRGMLECFPAYAMYMMRLTEDYLDYNEEYLDGIGAIDWE
ncbi:MAG: hypothetical protein LBR98_08625 [Syntrophomonadaceae bacterium]|jgi:hypothetical protein|nr:hypothetical protein [Syntrophomonadaceae bacterium]